MRSKRWRSVLTLTLVIGLVSLVTAVSSKVADAAAPYTCTWTGATNDNFSVSGNWSGCNSAAPQPGDDDNLIFDNTGLSSGPTLTNDITGLNVGSITFDGSGTYAFNITGNGITLNNGITQTGSGLAYININITLNSSQTFTDNTSNGLNIGNGTTLLALGSNQLTVDGTNVDNFGAYLDSILSGTGSLVVNMTNGVYIGSASPSYSGLFQINNGYLTISDPSDLGTGSVAIASGAGLQVDSGTNAVTATIPNDITMAGSGISGGSSEFQYGAISSCLGVVEECTDSGATDLTFTGTITLTGDAEVVNGAYYTGESSLPTNTATFTFTGPIDYNGYTLTAMPDSATVVVLPSIPSSGGSSPSNSSPKLPDTGVPSRSWPVALLVSGLALITAVEVGRRVRLSA